MVNEEEKDVFKTCTKCGGDFHRTVLKTVEAEVMCPTCIGKLEHHEKPGKKIASYQKGMSNLLPRIKRLREASYKLEVGYARLWAKKRALEEKMTPVKKIPTGGTSRSPHQSKQLTEDQIIAQLMAKPMAERMELLKKLGGKA